MGTAQDFLDQTLTDWGVPQHSREMVLNAFNSFVHKQYDIYSKQTIEECEYLWEQIRDNVPLWNAISEISMKLHCSPCSKASCEQTISMKRLVLTAKRMRSKKELLDARLTTFVNLFSFFRILCDDLIKFSGKKIQNSFFFQIHWLK